MISYTSFQRPVIPERYLTAGSLNYRDSQALVGSTPVCISMEFETLHLSDVVMEADFIPPGRV
jgi:hypothetical protein